MLVRALEFAMHNVLASFSSIRKQKVFEAWPPLPPACSLWGAPGGGGREGFPLKVIDGAYVQQTFDSCAEKAALFELKKGSGVPERGFASNSANFCKCVPSSFFLTITRTFAKEKASCLSKEVPLAEGVTARFSFALVMYVSVCVVA